MHKRAGALKYMTRSWLCDWVTDQDFFGFSLFVELVEDSDQAELVYANRQAWIDTLCVATACTFATCGWYKQLSLVLHLRYELRDQLSCFESQLCKRDAPKGSGFGVCFSSCSQSASFSWLAHASPALATSLEVARVWPSLTSCTASFGDVPAK